MAGFSVRPLALLVASLFAAVPASQAASANGLELRLERRFNVLAKRKQVAAPDVGVAYPVDTLKGDTYPLFVVADRLSGRTDEVAEAEGDVELRKAGSQIFGDRMTYWPLDDEVDAEGNVRILQDGQDMRTPHVRMKLSEQIGFAENVDYLFVREVKSRFYQPIATVVTVASTNTTTSGAPMMINVPNSYGLPTVGPETRPSSAAGTAARAEFEGENQVRLFESTYSTCKPGERDWYLSSSDMLLDYDENVGDARNATVYFKDVPLFYTPVATFPLNNQRHSGFLHPWFATSTRDGIDVTLPYYWNIAPNYDATFYPRYMSKRGLQLSGEAQYYSQNARSLARAQYMPNDQLTDTNRYAYLFQHQQNLGRGFSTIINWNGVSDDFYWQDTSSRLLQTSQTQLPRQAVLGYQPVPWLQGNLQLLRYQTLQTDPANPVAIPYFLEPQLNIIAFKPNVLLTDFGFIGQYSRFTHPTQVQGDRMVLYPQISVPFVHPAFTVTPKIGLHSTQYALNDQVAGMPESLSRTVPVLSLDSTVAFERETSLLGRNFIQTLEPRLYYVNIPYRDQNNFPVFDTALTDFNFAQIFAENRYSGFDRINDANQATAAVTTRMLDAETGVERFKALVGQRYYFRQSRVVLTNALGQPIETPPPQGWSNLITAVNGLVLPKTYVDAAWEYNYRDNVSQRFSIGMRYQPELGKVVSAGYRYTRDPLTEVPQVDQIDIAGQWPLTTRLSVVGRYNYSFRDNQLLEVIAGLEYAAGCWALRVVAQRLEAIAGSPNTSLYVQLELNDFASVGANPIGLLRRTIPGYGKINELPASGSMLMNP